MYGCPLKLWWRKTYRVSKTLAEPVNRKHQCVYHCQVRFLYGYWWVIADSGRCMIWHETWGILHWELVPVWPVQGTETKTWSVCIRMSVMMSYFAGVFLGWCVFVVWPHHCVYDGLITVRFIYVVHSYPKGNLISSLSYFQLSRVVLRRVNVHVRLGLWIWVFIWRSTSNCNIFSKQPHSADARWTHLNKLVNFQSQLCHTLSQIVTELCGTTLTKACSMLTSTLPNRYSMNWNLVNETRSHSCKGLPSSFFRQFMEILRTRKSVILLHPNQFALCC